MCHHCQGVSRTCGGAAYFPIHSLFKSPILYTADHTVTKLLFINDRRLYAVSDHPKPGVGLSLRLICGCFALPDSKHVEYSIMYRLSSHSLIIE